MSKFNISDHYGEAEIESLPIIKSKKEIKKVKRFTFIRTLYFKRRFVILCFSLIVSLILIVSFSTLENKLIATTEDVDGVEVTSYSVRKAPDEMVTSTLLIFLVISLILFDQIFHGYVIYYNHKDVIV